MHGLMVVLAGAALLGAHLLRPPAGARWLGASAWFLAGLFVTAGLIRIAADEAGIGRTTDFDRIVNHAVRAAGEAGEAPLIVFTGASFSRNAIDDDRLTAALRERGFPHTVINFSLEAASLAEREAHLDAFVERAGRTPDIVFIEVAETFDTRPTQFFGNSKFSMRGIEQFDLRTSAYAGFGLLDGGCNGAADCVRESGLLGAHFALNLLNVGLVGRGEYPDRAGELAAWDPQTEPRTDIDPDTRSAGLAAATISQPSTAPRWITSMRSVLTQRLESTGAAVGFYFPPVIDPGMRAYAAGLCAGELSAHTCIAPDAPDLLAALDRAVWLDEEHLLAPGAAAYTDWLAARLVDSGLLDRTAMEAHAQTEAGAP